MSTSYRPVNSLMRLNVTSPIKKSPEKYVITSNYHEPNINFSKNSKNSLNTSSSTQ